MNEKLYLIKNNTTIWSKEHDSLLQYLSPERIAKIIRYKFDSDGVNSLYAAILTRLAITRILKCANKELSFEYPKNHKPVFNPSCHPKANSVDFNLSHTKGAILVGVTTDESIGVDIEKITDAPFDVMCLVFHPDEINYINNFSDSAKSVAFYEIWTKKEAYTKCFGTGLITDLCSINTLEAPLNSIIETWTEDDYTRSVCIETL